MERQIPYSREHHSYELKKKLYRLLGPALVALALAGCASPPAYSEEIGVSTAWVTFNQDGTIRFNLEGFRNEQCQAPDDIPQDLAHAIVKHFGTHRIAAEAAVVAWSENGKFDPFASPVNTDGSVDTGFMQISSQHLPLLQRELGIHSMEDLYDPDLNLAAARLIFDQAGGSWEPWFGPENQGCDVMH
jgi:hypothetical protein